MLLLHFASLLGRCCHHAVFHKIVISITMGFPLLGIIFSLTGVSLALSPSSFLLFLRLEPVSLSLLSASIVLETLSSQKLLDKMLFTALPVTIVIELWRFRPLSSSTRSMSPPTFRVRPHISSSPLTFRVRPFLSTEFAPSVYPIRPLILVKF